MSDLECIGVHAGYVKARPCVRGVDFTLNGGEVVSLLGPNGAGKTTLLMALAGLLPRMQGRVSLDGQELRSGRPRDASQSKVILVPDDRALFRNLSVEQNLRLAIRGRPRTEALEEILQFFPALRKRLKVNAGRLSGGEQQMLAIGRAVVQQPRVLLIDELSMGLAPVIVGEILPVLRALADGTGVGVLLVEQHVHLALEVADRAIVLVHGEIALMESTASLRRDPKRIERAYLGTSAAA